MAMVMWLTGGLGLMVAASACSVKGVTYTPTGGEASDGGPVDSFAVGDAEMLDGSAIDGSTIDGSTMDGSTDGPGTPGNPAGTCAELQAAGLPSGVYWLRGHPRNASVFEVYCEQGFHGGGWAMVENSVRREDGTTLAFWQFPYSERLSRRGTPAADQNYYQGALYLIGTVYMDLLVDLGGKSTVAVMMTANGIDETTMRFAAPMKISGNQAVYSNQFASGWASLDRDEDSHPDPNRNCSLSYSNVAQHYGACWGYNLGSDGDSPLADNGVGPHVDNAVLDDIGLARQPDGGSYSQVRRIARFTRW